MKKIIISLALLFLLISTASALRIAGERDVNVFIDGNTIEYTKSPESGEYFYSNFQIEDANGLPLRSHNADLIVRDSTRRTVGKYNSTSDDNGFIRHSHFLNACNVLNEQFCYNTDQVYDLLVTAKNLSKEYTFTVGIQKANKNLWGDFMRWLAVNAGFLILSLFMVIFIITISIISFKLIRGRQR